MGQRQNLRKTYIIWMYRAKGINTGLLTSHSGEKVLQDHLLIVVFYLL